MFVKTNSIYVLSSKDMLHLRISLKIYLHLSTSLKRYASIHVLFQDMPPCCIVETLFLIHKHFNCLSGNIGLKKNFIVKHTFVLSPVPFLSICFVVFFFALHFWYFVWVCSDPFLVHPNHCDGNTSWIPFYFLFTYLVPPRPPRSCYFLSSVLKLNQKSESQSCYLPGCGGSPTSGKKYRAEIMLLHSDSHTLFLCYWELWVFSSQCSRELPCSHCVQFPMCKYVLLEFVKSCA